MGDPLVGALATQNTGSCTKSGNIPGGVLDFLLYPRSVSPRDTILGWLPHRDTILGLGVGVGVGG